MSSILNFCKYLKVKNYEKNYHLLKEGEADDTLYILKEGKVEVKKNGIQISEISKPGSLFGEMSVLLNIPHTADVITLTDSGIYTIEKASDFLKDQKEFSYHLSRILAERLQIVTKTLSVLKTQLKGNVDEVDDVLVNLL